MSSTEILASILDQMPTNLKDEKTTDAQALRDSGKSYTYSVTLRKGVKATSDYRKVIVKFTTIGYDQFDRDRRYTVKAHKVGDSTIHIPSGKLWEGLAEYIDARKVDDARKVAEKLKQAKASDRRFRAWEAFQGSIPEGFEVHSDWANTNPWEGSVVKLTKAPVVLVARYSYPTDEHEDGVFNITKGGLSIEKPTVEDIEALTLFAEATAPAAVN